MKSRKEPNKLVIKGQELKLPMPNSGYAWTHIFSNQAIILVSDKNHIIRLIPIHSGLVLYPKANLILPRPPGKLTYWKEENVLLVAFDSEIIVYTITRDGFKKIRCSFYSSG